MRAHEFLKESTTTLNKLYNGNFPDRDESFWDEVRPHEFDNELKVKIMPKYKLAIMLQGQYRVEHLDEILDMMDEDQQEILQRYMSDPNLSNKIILLSGDRIIDGNHRALAAAMKGVPINYVDLADLDEQGVTESTSDVTPTGYTWSFEHGGEVPYKSEVEVNTFIRVRDSKGKTVLGVWADVYGDDVEIQYSEVFDKKLRGKGIYTDFLRGLAKHYNIISDQDQNNAARNIYKKLGADYNSRSEKHTLRRSSQGVAEDTVDEMALSTYKTMGDFSKPGPFTGADKKLVPHPKNIEKATRFFEQTPFDFRLFFSHLKGTGKYSEHGPMSPDQIRQVFGQDAEEIINGSEDAITVVYVGNKGDAKVMLTPWMMAHRFGHAINAGARNKNWTAWGEAENYFFQTVNNLLDEHYGKVPATKPPGRNMLFQLTPEYNALFNAMGTQRSSTSGQIRRPYEFLYELFAQYLGTGKVTLNPLPTNLGYGRRVFGNPTKYMNIKPEYRDESERKQAADSLAYTMELLFNDVLSDSVGKIFVM